MKLFILCPVRDISGGPELLHQFGYAARQAGEPAYMAYYDNSRLLDMNAAEPYRKYEIPHEYRIDVINREENVIVIPERVTVLAGVFPQCKKVFWWLSVDGYVTSHYVALHYHERGLDAVGFQYHPDWLHMVQSFYARDFITQAFHIPEERITYLSDYLNDEFLEESEPVEKEDIIVFNPKKGKETLDHIRELAPELAWVPLQNMTAKEVHDTLKKAKVYVDFGHHPGKDRIPREAAISGCCVITGREGSADYREDVPIPDRYKFRDPKGSAEEILTLIRDIFLDYSEHSRDFEDYRNVIRQEKGWFSEDLTRSLRWIREFFSIPEDVPH